MNYIISLKNLLIKLKALKNIKFLSKNKNILSEKTKSQKSEKKVKKEVKKVKKKKLRTLWVRRKKKKTRLTLYLEN